MRRAGEAADPLSSLLSQIQGGSFDATKLQRMFDDIGINLPEQDIAGGLRGVLGLGDHQSFDDLMKGIFPDMGVPQPFEFNFGDLGQTPGVSTEELRSILGELGPSFGQQREPVAPAPTIEEIRAELEKLDLTGGEGGIPDPQPWLGYEPADVGDAADLTTDPLTSDDGFLGMLQAALKGRIQTDPLDVAGLRADPQTASLLAELNKRGEDEERARMEQLNRLGVLRSGDTAEALGDLSGQRLRGELDILGQAAERGRLDRDAATGQGVSLGGTLSQRELGLAEGRRADRQGDLDQLAAALAALDPDLKKDREDVDFNEIARAIIEGLGGGDLDINALMDAIGLGPRTRRPIPDPTPKEDPVHIG